MAAPQLQGLFSTPAAKSYFTLVLIKSGLKDRAIKAAVFVALPNALITLCVRLLASEGLLPWFKSEPGDPRLLDIQTAVWTSAVAGVTFLVVFRASHAYNRYWEAQSSVQLLKIEWLDAFSALLAFCSTSSAIPESILRFKHKMVRLFSFFHAAALLRLVEPGIDDEAISQIAVLNPTSLDQNSKETLKENDHRFEIIGQWIQVAIMHAINEGVVAAAPPLVTRCFQEIANGNVKFQDALKVKSMPFPPSYQLVCDILLLMHWVATPFFSSLWVNSPTIASALAFFAVFILWSLTFVARSIENPFCTKMFLREAVTLQHEMNERLLVLMQPIAGQVPFVPDISDEQLKSPLVELETLENFFADEGEQTENENSGSTPSLVTKRSMLSSRITEKSKVHFSTRIVQRLMRSKSEEFSPRRSRGSRRRSPGKSSCSSDMVSGSSFCSSVGVTECESAANLQMCTSVDPQSSAAEGMGDAAFFPSEPPAPCTLGDQGLTPAYAHDGRVVNGGVTSNSGHWQDCDVPFHGEQYQQNASHPQPLRELRNADTQEAKFRI